MRLPMRESNAKNIQLLYLLLGGGTVFLFVYLEAVFSEMGYFLAEKYLPVPCLLFFGSALTQRLSPLAKKSLLLSAVTVLWFAIVQLRHELTGMGLRSFGIFAFAYLLGFPFAAVTEDGKTGCGMKLIGKIYAASAMVSVLCTALLVADAVPERLAGAISYDGARVMTFWHPNVGACALMLGVGFSLYFLVSVKKKWTKALLVTMIVLEFVAMVLTNSRTAILLTCGLAGGTLFFRLWKGGWKQFLAAFAAATAAILLLFFLYDSIFDWHTQNRINDLLAQAETTASAVQSPAAPAVAEAIPSEAVPVTAEEVPGETVPVTAEEIPGETAPEVPNGLKIDKETGEISLVTESAQSELSESMKSMNGRTVIWKATIQTLQDNPEIRLWGSEYAHLEISYRNPFQVGHAHNAWLQTWILLGTPAFLMSLVYTLLAVVNAVWLMFRKNMELNKKIVALMVMCMLAAGILEPYLFAGEMTTSFVNFLFFFCTGYLMQWNVDASISL